MKTILALGLIGVAAGLDYPYNGYSESSKYFLSQSSDSVPRAYNPGYSLNQINGLNNIVTGRYNYLSGSNNRVQGQANNLRGAYNDVYGMGNYLKGSTNLIYGMDNSINGVNNEVKGTKNTVNGYNNQVSGTGNVIGSVDSDYLLNSIFSSMRNKLTVPRTTQYQSYDYEQYRK